MNVSDDPSLGDDEAALAARLAAASPRPSPALRRRVRHRIAAAFGEKVLRQRSAALIVGGTILLGLAATLAVTAPT